MSPPAWLRDPSEALPQKTLKSGNRRAGSLNHLPRLVFVAGALSRGAYRCSIRPMIIALLGFAGTGKDTVADILAKGSLTKVALADPLKRVARDVFDFTEEQLWGPSYMRNQPDSRYPREHTFVDAKKRRGSEDLLVRKCACCGYVYDSNLARGELATPDPGCYLTPRYALQTLGTEWGRDCFPDVWVNYCIRIHEQLQAGHCLYDQKSGLRWHASVDGVMTPKKNVVVSDNRFKNELEIIKKAGGIAVRIVRPGVEIPAWQHPSETEQMSIPDDFFHHILRNEGTLDDLEVKVQGLIKKLAL